MQGFYDKDALQLLIQRRTLARDITTLSVNEQISGRTYQIKAIRHVCEHFMARQRKALLVMATGTGKTRTTIGLVELLIKGNWVKRVLFLADRQAFYIFDYCQNFEFFNANPQGVSSRQPQSLNQRLFNLRLELLAELGTEAPELSNKLKASLQQRIANMPQDNFIVRPKLEYVTTYAKPERWQALTPDDYRTLATHLSALPTTAQEEEEETKRFDLLMLKLQLALLQTDNAFEHQHKQLITIASQLESRAAIPMIKQQLDLIQELQQEQWWRGVTLDMLEEVRLCLRTLVQFIEKQSRTILYTDFADQFGTIRETRLDYFTADRASQEAQSHPLLDPTTLQAHFAPLQQRATAQQDAFIDAIITYLTQNGPFDSALLYEPPFTNHHYAGPDGLFEDEEVDMLFDLLEQINEQM